MYNNEQNGYQSYYGDGYGGYQQPPRKKRSLKWLWITLICIGAVFVIAFSSIQLYNLLAPASDPGLDDRYSLVIPEESGEPEQEETPAEQESAQQDEDGSSSGSGKSVKLTLNDLFGESMTPQEVAQEVIPSVVCIQNYQTVSRSYGYGFGFQSGAQSSSIELYGEGSGIILTDDGYIITNAHVVEGGELIKVVLSDDEIYEATLVGEDDDTDIAVIKIEASGLTCAKLGSSENLAVGEYVMAIGNPGGLEFSSSATLGIVSAVDRPLAVDKGYTMNTIQTDAAINPGNSGGALVNMEGQVVGICSAKYVATGYEGLGFAITIDEAVPIVEDLIAYGRVQNRPMLGISGLLLDSMTAQYYNLKVGYYVSEIRNTDAGALEPEDIITAIDGSEILTESDIKNAIYGKTPGSSVTLTVYRPDTGKTFETQLILMNATE